ncbi:hypothetical protein ANCDUO_03285 [Ancylostoma duodenale]|uniref:LIM zinc-binding domain-containing protein n=1 Tax=Ancylostoma duodenale TaxID=51022 RepID=A0A0C2H4D8_9BILA|nr:hypothetical protein ANCDUO_03285 [Ancylostoma duodenale]
MCRKSRESRVPASVRSAVSPRRSFRKSKQWPPEKSVPTLRYWQIDPTSQSRKEKEHEPTSLHDLIEESDREKSPKPQRRQGKKVPQAAPRQPVASVVYSKVFKGHGDVGLKTTEDRPPSGAEVSANISLDRSDTNTGIQGTVTPAPITAQLTAQGLIEKCSSDKRAENLAEIPELHLSESEWDTHSIQADVPLEHFEQATSLQVPQTTDSSTSPIPTIELPRRRAAGSQQSGIVRALSPTPFKPPPAREITPEPIEELPKEPPHSVTHTPHPSEHPSLLVGINTTPRPFVPAHPASEPLDKPTKAKPQKKVDFSKATLIPDAWKNTTEVVDESDIATEPQLSPGSTMNSPSMGRERDEKASHNASAPYDGDVSDIYDNKSDNGSAMGSYMAEEHERWMQEELELARKEELAEMGPPEMQQKADHHEKEEWRQQAMALLNDDSQAERDYAIVAALHERLQGLRDMEEADRLKAIECIEKHQRNLEEQQDQLSVLLDSAIAYLRNLDTTRSTVTGSSPQPQFPLAPLREGPSCSEVKVDSLSEVLEELEAIPARYRGPGDFIAEQLSQLSHIDQQGQSFTRSTFEQRTEQRTVGGGGTPIGGHSTKQVEIKGHGMLNNPGSRVPVCEACKQQIRQVSQHLRGFVRIITVGARGAYVLATGLAWCPEHFVCAYRGCGRRLLECGFVEENGLKYCEGCFEAHIAPRCAKCSKPIISVSCTSNNHRLSSKCRFYIRDNVRIVTS